MTHALQGLRVLDLSNGPAGGIATMIMADFGADVIHINRPSHAPEDALAQLNAAPMWRRGKHSLTLDLNAEPERDQFNALAATADVLLTTWRQSALQRAGLDFETLHKQHPRLIYCHITGFGRQGPMADCPGYEHTVAAYSGRMQLFQGLVEREGPVFSALQVGVHGCAQSAVSGTLAALFARQQNEQGRLVETSLLQAMQPYEMGAMIGMQFLDKFPDLRTAIAAPTAQPPLPSLFYHPAQAGDGRWMQFGNLLPHLFDNFLIATDLIDVIADEDFNPKQLLLRTPEKQEAFRARMLQKIQQRSADEWMAQFIADGGIVAAAYQTTQEALDDPDIVANGHVRTMPDGSRQLGPLANLTNTPASPESGSPINQNVLPSWQPRQSATDSSASQPDVSGQSALPLAGVRVIELATIIAAPLGAAFLADMGAEVIKVEQVGGDPFRGMLSGLGAARVNAGKRSISVNLKSEAGLKIVMALLSEADIAIHNFRPGVPERLGISYEQVSAINPNIVYVQSNGYGPDGPGALRPSTHPIPGAAMGGVMYQMGEQLPADLQDIDGLKLWCSRLMRANELNPDPNTAVVVATSAMLGLAARQHTQRGQQVLIDMFGANAYANSDDFLRYPGKPKRLLPDAQLQGLSPTYRLYPCANNSWVFLGLVSKRDKANFSAALEQAAIAAPDLADSAANVIANLTNLFADKDAKDWQQLLGHVGCVQADGLAPNEFWLNDAQVQHLNLTAKVEHPSWGPYKRHGPLVMFDGKRQPLGAPPLAGQHNAELLAELGYTEQQIAAYFSDGVLWQED